MEDIRITKLENAIPQVIVKKIIIFNELLSFEYGNMFKHKFFRSKTKPLILIIQITLLL